MPENDKITVAIDGQRVETVRGKTVLEAALDAGIYIPNLCYDPRLEPYGGCRLCIVKIEGMRGLPTACTTRAADGMVVRSEDEEVMRVRRMTMELLISDHPNECLTCGANQDCRLQAIAKFLGIDELRVKRNVRPKKIDDSNPFFVRDSSKCVLCGKCVRICREVRGVGNLDFAGRGYKADVATFGSGLITDSRCESCGACVDICPVGALLPRLESLPPTHEVVTVCPYCGCGCGLVLGIRITRGAGSEGDVELLEEIGQAVKAGALCGLGQTAPNPVLSTIRYFRDEYDAHIRDRRCPARVCRDLVTYTIDPEKCIACGKCRRVCPAEAIEGEKKVKHAIRQEKCVRCGACFEACPVDAVGVA